MKTEEKSTNNERQALIIRKYQQYLKLEKALSANTLDAYLTDLNKLLCFLKTENIDMLAVTLDDLQLPDYTTSVFIPARKHVSCRE